MELSAKALAIIVDSAIDTAIIALDHVGRVLTWSAGAQAILGWSEEEMVGESIERIFPPDDHPAERVAEEMAEASRVGRGGHEGWRIRKDGSRLWAFGEMTPVVDPAAAPVAFVKVLRDRTAFKLAEDGLKEETRCLEVLNRTGVQLGREADVDRLIQSVTDAGVEITRAQFGAFFYTVQREDGERYMLYALSGADRDAFRKFPMPRNTAVFASTFRGEGIVRSGDITQDPRYGRSDTFWGMPAGHLKVRSYLAVPVLLRSGEVLGALLFGHPEPDVFDERSERSLVLLAAEAAIAIDNARLHSEAQREIAERRRAEEALQTLNATLEEQVAERTEQLRLNEDVLRQAQKMEAVGQLTGGIAHDFNNLLMGITGSLELLARQLAQGRVNGLDRYVNSAQGAAKRAASLTHRLLAFSRRQTLDPKAIDINRLVMDMEELIRRTVGPSIALDVATADGVWATRVDPNQLESALLNLCINARDAMPDGGRLTVETANRCLDDRTSREHDLAPGQYLSLSVSDTGTGMSPEVVQRAFDPFFTTKPIGLGTGLGLSMVYGFARQSGGQVGIQSELGRGTTITIYLPRHEGEAMDELDVESEAPFAQERGATVLVIDDEPTVRMVVSDVLGELGYDVLEAPDGNAGLKILQADGRIDLLVTDVGLPGGMNGRQVADAALGLRPQLKVLFITGYAENAAVGQGHLRPGMAVLTKPFNVDALAARVHGLMAA